MDDRGYAGMVSRPSSIAGVFYTSPFSDRLLARPRHRADLLHEPQLIERTPMLGDLAAADAEEVDPGDLHLLAGSGDAHQLALMGAARRPARGEAIALSEH